jgi:hypothetical protein
MDTHARYRLTYDLRHRAAVPLLTALALIGRPPRSASSGCDDAQDDMKEGSNLHGLAPLGIGMDRCRIEGGLVGDCNVPGSGGYCEPCRFQ